MTPERGLGFARTLFSLSRVQHRSLPKDPYFRSMKLPYPVYLPPKSLSTPSTFSAKLHGKARSKTSIF